MNYQSKDSTCFELEIRHIYVDFSFTFKPTKLATLQDSKYNNYTVSKTAFLFYELPGNIRIM